MANRKLKGQQEHHVIFKFDTDEEATAFIKMVKEWYYSLEGVSDKIKVALKEPVDEIDKSFAKIKIKDLPNNEVKTTVKKPVPQKRKTGRPTKKNLQGQKR